MSENVFTDDDLKRVKDINIGANSGREYRMVVVVLDRADFTALLARLEAAENLAEFSITDEHDDNCASYGCRKEYTSAWRAAAGK